MAGWSRGLKALLAVVVLGLSGWLVVTDEWRYPWRFVTYPDTDEINDPSWYTPQVVVPGDFGAALPTVTSTIIDPIALEKAASYAFRMQSSAFVVAHRGEVVMEYYAPGRTRTSRTNSMSMAKSIVSLLIGVAIEDGAIGSVDDRVARYLPEFDDEQRSKITIRDLLEMASGLRLDRRKLHPSSDLLRLHIGPAVAPVVLGLPSIEESGRWFEYNNCNTQLLALVLERATGTDLATYLSNKLWKPMGGRDAALWLDRPGGHARAYCCLFATARDWVRVGQLILQKGRYQGRQVVAEGWIQAISAPSRDEPEYGLHIWRAHPLGERRMSDRREEFVAQDMVYLDGRGKQRVYVIPSRQLVIVRVGEHPYGKWDDAVIPNLLVRGMSPRK